MLQLHSHLIVSALNLSLDQELQRKLAKLCIFSEPTAGEDSPGNLTVNDQERKEKEEAAKYFFYSISILF